MAGAGRVVAALGTWRGAGQALVFSPLPGRADRCCITRWGGRGRPWLGSGRTCGACGSPQVRPAGVSLLGAAHSPGGAHTNHPEQTPGPGSPA